MAACVLVLGGYGMTGTILSELLLERSDATVVIAGRDLGKAQRQSEALATRHPGRVAARRADAANPASLADALDGVDLMAVAAAVMVRALAPRCARLERAEIGGLIKADWNAYDFAQATMSEFVEEMRDYRTEALRDGVWSAVHWREMTRVFDFGSPWGREWCFLMSLEELRRLPQSLPSLRDCGFYVSGFNPVVDWLLMPLGTLALEIAPEAAGPACARLLAWGLRRFGRPPFGCVWQVEARGETANGRRELGLRVSHADGYWLTAASAAACLRQCLDGSLRTPGVQLQALAVEPARFLRDLHAMGADLAGRGFKVSEILAQAVGRACTWAMLAASHAGRPRGAVRRWEPRPPHPPPRRPGHGL